MNRKKLILITLVAALLALLVFYVFTRNNNESDNQVGADGLTGVEYKEATDEEKAESDENKNKVTERINQENNQNDNGSTKSVKPVISAYGQNTVNGKVEVGSYVPGVFENGGKCTTILQNNGVSKTKMTDGIENVSNVSCGFAVFEQGELTSGTWSATVSYNSKSASGVSDPVQIEVN